MPDDPDKRVRPSQEIASIGDYFLGAPNLNVALQQGGIRLGQIASHIVTTYYVLKEKCQDAEGKEDLAKLTAKEKRWYQSRKVFVEKKIPILAAELGPNITDQLLAAYIATTQNRTIIATGLKANFGDFGDIGLKDPALTNDKDKKK